jgi:hypothetical protein
MLTYQHLDGVSYSCKTSKSYEIVCYTSPHPKDCSVCFGLCERNDAQQCRRCAELHHSMLLWTSTITCAWLLPGEASLEAGDV